MLGDFVFFYGIKACLENEPFSFLGTRFLLSIIFLLNDYLQ